MDGLDKEAYKRMRSRVERLFAWLTGDFRRLALKWERLTSTFLGFIQLASIIIYWRVFEMSSLYISCCDERLLNHLMSLNIVRSPVPASYPIYTSLAKHLLIMKVGFFMGLID